MHKNRKPMFGVGINDHPQSVWVNGKVYGYSLNKFRKLLELMTMQNSIKIQTQRITSPLLVYLGD